MQREDDRKRDKDVIPLRDPFGLPMRIRDLTRRWVAESLEFSTSKSLAIREAIISDIGNLLQDEPNNEAAWLCLADIAEVSGDRLLRIYCIAQTLHHNPSNTEALIGLASIGMDLARPVVEVKRLLESALAAMQRCGYRCELLEIMLGLAWGAGLCELYNALRREGKAHFPLEDWDWLEKDGVTSKKVNYVSTKERGDEFK